MMLVLETSPGVKPDSDEEIKKILAQHGLQSAGAPQVFGEHAFHYYPLQDTSKAQGIIQQLSGLSTVQAAYLKPEGEPPSI